MSEPACIAVEVVYALPRRQWLIAMKLPAGATVADAIERSALREAVPELIVDDAHVGVHAQPVTLATPLREGDRVELYRPLQVDPMQARRLRAETQRAKRAR